MVDHRKADYYRYLAEFKAGNERKEVAEKSMKAYEVRLCTLDFNFCFFICMLPNK